ncbi:hypothetical protein NDU88_002065 [Pleurodeles waltl]|uniref:Centromere protein Q n=1 Tax=Pleurodeles waltl TaxID=8319 RepID=A0AAV7M9Y0_PLEWA|nr:hypothetical protein NDU88_002065 [Pleurodeles waltl]
MGRTKSDRPGMAGLGLRMTVAQREPGASPYTLVATILAAHAQKFEDILNAVQSIKSTLEPKIDALHIDVGHLREEHNKLKDRTVTTESTVSELCPLLANPTKHIKDLQKEVLHLHQRLEDKERRSSRNNTCVSPRVGVEYATMEKFLGSLHLPRVSPSDREALEALLQLIEIEEVIKGMVRGKTPGTDQWPI